MNVWAPWLFMCQVVPGMHERGRGWVLNLTCFVGSCPRDRRSHPTPATAGSVYGSTKAALNRLTLAAAGEN